MARLTLNQANDYFNQYDYNVGRLPNGRFELVDEEYGATILTNSTLSNIMLHGRYYLLEVYPQANFGESDLYCYAPDVDTTRTFTSPNGDYCILDNNFCRVWELDNADFDAIGEGDSFCPLPHPTRHYDSFIEAVEYASCDLTDTPYRVKVYLEDNATILLNYSNQYFNLYDCYITPWQTDKGIYYQFTCSEGTYLSSYDLPTLIKAAKFELLEELPGSCEGDSCDLIDRDLYLYSYPQDAHAYTT